MMFRARFLVPLFLFLVLPLSPLRAAADPSLADKARMLLDYQSFMLGDRDGGVRFCLTASRELQGTPLAELAARIALSYDQAWLTSIGVGETEARRALSTEGELTPEQRDVLRRYVARAQAAAGRREEAMAIHRQRGLCVAWLIAGPFYGRRPANFGSRELPDAGPPLATDVLAEPPNLAGFREWRKQPPKRNLPVNRAFPFVRPWRWAGGAGDGSMVLYSGVEMSTGDNKSEFHVYSDTSWQLFVDGTLVAEVDRNNVEAPREHMVAYPLEAGVHTVALQVFPPSDEDRAEDMRVALRLESESAFTWRPDADLPAAPPAVNARREARPLRHLRELRERINDHPIIMAAYAIACAEQGMPDEAAWWAETAARAGRSDVNLQLVAGMLTAANPLLPGVRRRDIAVGWHRAALAIKPDLVPSLLFLAESAAGAERPRRAAELLDRAYAVNQGSLDVLLARAEWASRFASGATARAAWDECGRAFPDSPGVQLAVASMPQDAFLDMERRLAACRAAAAAGPYNPEAAIKLAEALADSGNNQEAQYALRSAVELFAGDVEVLTRVAEVYSRLSLYEEATRILSDAVRLAPDNPDLWRRLGDLRMEADDADGAEAYWRVSLDARPGQFALADMLADQTDGADSIQREGGYDAIALTASADVKGIAGDVIRLLDRSVMLFAADGSHRRLSHEVDLAGTRKGGESLADIGRPGELLTARIVFPNGNTLEPEPYPGRSGLRLPVIMPGAAREVRVLESSPLRRGEAAGIPAWYFQDPSGRMPLMLSEYMVRTPRNFPLATVVHNLGNEVDYEVSQEGDETVHRWTARLGPPSHEPDAVHVSERIPSVEIGVKTTWDEVTYRELRRLEGRLKPSMRMRSLLTYLFRGQEGGSPDPLRAARSIYRYVCDNIDPAAGGSTAAHIQADRMGDRRLLLLALLRAAGMDADPAMARPSAKFMHPATWELPDPRLFTVPMVRLAVPGGDTYWLDVRFDSLPFGKIADDLSEATAISFLPGGPLFETLPSLPAEDSLAFREKRLELPAPGGDLVATGRNRRRGVAGLRREQEMAGADNEARKRLVLTSLFPVFPDAVLRRFEILKPDAEEASYQETYEITSGTAVEARPDGAYAVSLCMRQPRFVSEEARNLPVRRTACHIKAPYVSEDRNVFVLPAGGSFRRLPAPAHIPSRFGVYQLRVTPRGENGMEVVRSCQVPAQRIQPWDWADFLEFLEKIDRAEKQWLEYTVAREVTTPAAPSP